MIKQIINISKGQKLLEEACVVLIEEIFNKIFNEYFDIKKNKINKLLGGIFKSFDTILEHKNNLTLIDNNLEFCTYFILMNYIDNIKGFIPSKLSLLN